MKRESHITQAEEMASSSAEDPFAVDLFATGRAGANASADAADGLAPMEMLAPGGAYGRGAKGSPPRVASWHAALPKVSREEARLSAMLSGVPATLSAKATEALAEVVARFTRMNVDGVAFDAVDTREEEISALAARVDSPRVYVRAAVEPWEARVVLVMDAAFASVLVERMLGGADAAPVDVAHPLSTAECAVIEFLSAQLLSAVNDAAGEPLFRLEGVSDKPDAMPSGTRGIVTAVRARIGSTSGLVRLVYSPEVLVALDELRGPLFARGADASQKMGSETKSARYEKFCAGADLHLQIGETEVDPVNLAELEVGDVLLVERRLADWETGHLAGTVRARVGGGDNVVVSGTVGKPARGGGENGRGDAETVRVFVEEISISPAQEADAERLSMEDERELATDASEEAGLLDNLLLTVRVELAARRISLEELTRLRAGQILDLGCRATDPVELVADGRRIATGELVDIEGRLGVRVTRLAG